MSQIADPLVRVEDQSGPGYPGSNGNFSPQDAAAEMLRDGSAILNFPVEELVVPVIRGWRDFLLLDQLDKDCCSLDQDSPDPDLGYLCRRPTQARHAGTPMMYDSKQFFHFKPGVPDLLRHRLPASPVFAEWVAGMETLHAVCLEKFFEIARHLDGCIPGFSFLERMKDPAALKLNTLRMIYYKTAQAAGELVAKFHPDRNLMTFHLDDSHPGLVVRKGLSDIFYKKEPGKVLLFPGSKAEALTSGRIPRCWHGVNADETAIGTQRWSIVFFVHTNTPVEFH